MISFFTEPFQHIDQIDKYKQAKLFSGIILIIIFLQIISIQNVEFISWVYSAGIFFNLLSYFFSRSRYYIFGAFLWGLSNSSVALLQIYSSHDFTGLYYLIFNLLIISLVSGPTSIITLTVLNILMILSFNYLIHDSIFLSDQLKNPFIFNFAGGIVIAGLLAYKKYLENIREAVIQNNERQIRLLMNSTSECIYGTNSDGICNFVNPACIKILGYSKESELLGKNMHTVIHLSHLNKEIFPEHHCRIHGKKYYKEKIHQSADLIWRKDGSFFYAETWANPIMHRGKIIGRIVTFIDITQKLETENNIRKSLLEKESLLREIHHRVKNNLQTIVSLLYLQSEKFPDLKLKSYFHTTRERIQSIGLVHEQLYHSSNLSHINFQEYLVKLFAQISANQNLTSEEIDFTIRCNEFFPGIDQAIPAGIIAYELINNSFLHAFGRKEADHKKSIDVCFKIQNGFVEAEFSDNGCGFDFNTVENRSDSGIGLFLVKAMLEQLDGTYEFKNQNGMQIQIRFPASV